MSTTSQSGFNMVYGEPEEIVVDSWGYDANTGDFTTYEYVSTWLGSNNTGIYLYLSHLVDNDDPETDMSSNAFGSRLIMCYGKTDSVEKLQQLEQAIQQEELEKERIERERNTNNTDGL